MTGASQIEWQHILRENVPENQYLAIHFEFKGHTIRDVVTFHLTALSLRPSKPMVYLAGDSSLDSEYWVPAGSSEGSSLRVDVPEIYRATLSRHHPKPDVAFWLNHLLGDLLKHPDLSLD
ncbi:hypothetical protein V502_01141 [Pseudogymnoascus sp. VKM F-4520 (FW-2644)]|nr:hypothetical protein V502_01141 [Pseudogymnoascus sp. VKM F-4520 (FW-2644)]